MSEFVKKLMVPSLGIAAAATTIYLGFYLKANEVKVDQLTKLPDNTIVNQATIFGDHKVKVGDTITISNYNIAMKQHQITYHTVISFGVNKKDGNVYAVLEPKSVLFGKPSDYPFVHYLNSAKDGLNVLEKPSSSILIDKKQIVNDGKNKNPDLQTPNTEILQHLTPTQPKTIPQANSKQEKLIKDK